VSSWDRATTITGGAGLLALAATYGIGRQVFGLFVPAFRAEFGLSLDVLGLYASAAQIGYLVMVLATGAVTARYGVRLPVVLGCALLALGSGLVAIASDPTVLAIGLVAAGASAGGTWAPFSDVVSDRVPSRGQGRALAMVNAGSPAGLVIAGILVLGVGDRW
jgi:MFS family permease